MVERVGAAEAADVLARAFFDDPVLTYLGARRVEARLRCRRPVASTASRHSAPTAGWWPRPCGCSPGEHSSSPELQGTGLGGALIAPGLARADGAPVHLDTGRPENVPWYRRFGFEVTDEVHAVPGAPPSWGMKGAASRT